MWDVRDAEAHVRALAAAWLREKPAYLDPTRHEQLVQYLMQVCWLLSGLREDGRTPRPAFAAVLTVAYASPRWSSLAGYCNGHVEETSAFNLRDDAIAAGEKIAREFQADGCAIAIEIVERRPRGAYDPQRGLMFSTYSRKILTLRIADWYRITFGDSRYSDDRIPLSLDQLVSEWERRDGTGADDSYLDRSGPGARADFIDELHSHVYDHELVEEAIVNAITR